MTKQKNRPDFRNRQTKALKTLLLMMLLSVPLFRLTPLDITVAHLFYHPENLPLTPWSARNNPFVLFLYHYAPFIALIPAFIAAGVLCAGLYSTHYARFRSHALYLLTALALGAGLLINGVLKEVVGKPRPIETIQFGGNKPYLPLLSFGKTGEGHSFPSGHAAVAFSLFSLAFLFSEKRKLSRIAFWGTILFGGLVGGARMAAGGHYLSDVLWAGFLCYLVSHLLYYYGFKVPEKEQKPLSGKPAENTPQKKTLLLALPLLLLLTAGALAMYPYETTMNYRLPPASEKKTPPSFRFFCDKCRLNISFSQDMPSSSPALITGFARGNGFPKSRIYHGLRHKTLKTGEEEFYFEMTTSGTFLEMNNEIQLSLSPGKLKRINIAVEKGDIHIRKMPPEGSGAVIHLSLPRGDVYRAGKTTNAEELKTAGIILDKRSHSPEPP